jgi:hypothetical protein
MPFANDEFRRTTTNIDHQPLVRTVGKECEAPMIDQARLFTTGNDFDRKTKRLFSLRQKFCRILGDAQRIGRDGTHRPAGPGLPNARQIDVRHRAHLACAGISRRLSAVQAGSETYRLLQASPGCRSGHQPRAQLADGSCWNPDQQQQRFRKSLTGRTSRKVGLASILALAPRSDSYKC